MKGVSNSASFIGHGFENDAPELVGVDTDTEPLFTKTQRFVFYFNSKFFMDNYESRVWGRGW